MAGTIGVVQFGCGPIGCSIARLAAQRPELALLGGIDVDPAVAGRDLGEVAGMGRRLGTAVYGDAAAALRDLRPAVVFHATGSRVADVFDQLAMITAAGANVVSTCEELAFPARRDPELAARLEELARRHGVSILGTGVNPGFLMDTWPLFMSGLCAEVRAVRVTRIQDAAARREPFQRKIGVGMSPQEFAAAVAGGGFGHVGLEQSAALLAAGFGWELDDFSEKIEPVLAEREVTGGYATVPPGGVVGLQQTAVGSCAGRPVVEFEFQAYVGAPRARDTVALTGTPHLEVTIPGGAPGDTATAAIVVNSAPVLAAAAPGLYAMKDLPVVACGPR